MNGSDFSRSGVPGPPERTPDGPPSRPANSPVSRWRESQPLPPAGPSDPRRAASGPPPQRGSSNWLREPALDPRRLMPPPSRHDAAPERPRPAESSRLAPAAPPSERPRNGSYAPPAEPRRSSFPPPPERGRGRFTERQQPSEAAEPPRSFPPPAKDRPPVSSPESRHTATPSRLEREPEIALPSRFIAPPPAEPPRDRTPELEPEAKRSAAPPVTEDESEIEAPRPIVPPLWERLRDKTPLFRSGRSKERESDLAPHRFIAPAPVERVTEQQAAPVAEAKHNMEPTPLEPESISAPQRFIAPPPAGRTTEWPPARAAETRQSLTPAPVEQERDSASQRFIPSSTVRGQHETAPEAAPPLKRPSAPLPESDFGQTPRSIASAPNESSPERASSTAFGRRTAAPPPYEPELDVAPSKFEPQAQRERPRGYSSLVEDEPQPTSLPHSDPETSPAVARFMSAPPTEHGPQWLSSEEDEPQWNVEHPPLEPEAYSALPRLATSPPVECTSEWLPLPSDEAMRTGAPHPFEGVEDSEPPHLTAPLVTDRAPESPLPAAPELRRNPTPALYSEEVDFAPPSARRGAEGQAREVSPRFNPEPRNSEVRPTFEAGPEPEAAPHPENTAPPERPRHWSTLFDEDRNRRRIESGMETRRATPPAPIERRPATTPEPVPEPTESLRAVAPSVPERARDAAPLFATEPKRNATLPPRDTEPIPERPRAMASALVEDSELSRDSIETADEDEFEEPRDPVFPKLLKRLATVGRAALPIVPHVLPREGRIGATVSAVTAVSSALAARAAQQTSAEPSAPVASKTDLVPLGDNIDVLRAAQKELRDKVADQTAVLERVQDQVDILCEASNRMEREQRDLVAELKFFSKWALVFAVAVSVLLMASVAFEVVLILRQ